MGFAFFLTAALLGVGLAMDAFSVSVANALREPAMRPPRMAAIAGVYAGFQYLMPMIGWVCVHTVVEYFTGFQKFIPWIALALLGYIGGKMLTEGIREARGNTPETDAEVGDKRVGVGTLFVQGVATSIDALSVGFTIAEYGSAEALTAGAVIAGVTFILCMVGLAAGKRLGTLLTGKATVVGGVILIGIGLEIFIKGVFFG